MKKILALVLALMLLVPSAMAAEQLADYYKPPVANEGQYPIAGENLTLTYWTPINAGAANFIPSYDENPSYQLIQQNTGVDIQFIHPAAGTETEAFQLMLAGDLPDAMEWHCATYPNDLQNLADDRFNGGGIEKIALAVVIRGSRDDHIIGIPVCIFSVKGSRKVKLLLCKIFFNIFILNR